MKSLVTGATGFIGGHLAEALVGAGVEVRALVRSTSDTRHLKDLPVEQFAGDLRDATSLRRAVVGVERVFHCGAVVSDWGDPAVFYQVNVEGTAQLLAAAYDAGIEKFVYVSSTEVYGHPDFPADEDAPYRYRGWPYCDTKIDAEKHAWAFAGRGLPLTVIRPATVYGPRWTTTLEFLELLREGSMILVTGGRKNAGLVYVDNLSDVLLLAGEPEAGLGRAYNVTDGLDVTWSRFINSLAAMLGQGPVRRSLPHWLAYAAGWTLERWARARRQPSRPLITRMAVEFIGTDQGFPNDRARRELGWRPRVDFETGMRRVETWLREEGYLDRKDVAPHP
jgi:nucleoside-diphosphate-sugar epimerase